MMTKNKIYSTIRKSAIAFIVLGSTASITTLPAQANLRDYSCQWYNAQWQLCTFQEYNPATDEWEDGYEFVPHPNQDATITP